MLLRAWSGGGEIYIVYGAMMIISYGAIQLMSDLTLENVLFRLIAERVVMNAD